MRNSVACVQQTILKLLSVNGKRTVDSFHRQLGKIVWDYCGMSRKAEGLETAMPRYGNCAKNTGRTFMFSARGRSESEPGAGRRVADFFELAELMCIDASTAMNLAGGHFREEYQTADGEAQRDDEHYAYVAAWEYRGYGNYPELSKEPLEFDYVHPSQRSYK